MLANLIDSQPREYPWLVSLIRRTAQGSSVAPPKCSIQELQDWMIQDAIKLSDLLILVEQWVWRLLAADFPIERFTLHVGTLHPQLTGFYWLWNKSDGIVDELQVSQAGLDTDRYRRSPLAVTIEGGEFFRARTDDPEMLQRYPLMQDLAAEGITDYCIFPLGSGGAYYNAVSLSTRITDGFSDQNLSQVKYLLAVFGLHVERHIAWRVAENVTQTYLGKVAADRVLSGTILRGAGESIRAVIWMSDLRGFTRLVDELQSEEVLVILNEYFERVAGAVIDHGGEVLKFMGDGLLAVFPVENFDNAEAAAATAVQAARQA
ncbi:MAG: adenylate cyclase, partial [Gammaproteobacteria bacterium]